MSEKERIIEKFEKLKAESIDNYNKKIDDSIGEAITKAYNESSDITTDVTYYAKSGKFLVGWCVKGTCTEDDDDAIIVYSVSSWSLLDDGHEISVEKFKAMSKEDVEYTVEQCAQDAKDQYITDEAKEKITNYFDWKSREAVEEIEERCGEQSNMSKEYHTVHVYCSQPMGDHSLVFTQEDWDSEHPTTITCNACGGIVTMGTRAAGEYEHEMRDFFMDESRTGIYENKAYQREQKFDVSTTPWRDFAYELDQEYGDADDEW